jgi:hypothetical protein
MKEIALKFIGKTTAGIRINNFSNAARFFTEVLDLEIAHYDKEKEFARFKLPSGQMLEVLGTTSIWQPFTTPPDWEVIVADFRYTKDKK